MFKFPGYVCVVAAMCVTGCGLGARTKLVCLENTQNSCGGVVLPLEYMNAVEQLCRHHNLKFHLDGMCVVVCARSIVSV